MSTATTLAKRTVLEIVQENKTKFTARLPEGTNPDRFFFGLCTAVQKNPDLLKCTPESVMLAAYEAAEVGCSLSPSLALGWLIPYKDQAQFQPSYRFFIQRAHATGIISNFFAEVVYANDKFERQYAPVRNLFHAPPVNAGRGEPIGAYALVGFKEGGIEYEYLTKEQIERHRKHSKQPDSLMWTKFWEEGWRKTPIRVLAKRLPQTSRKMEELAELIAKDEEKDFIPIEPGKIESEPTSDRPDIEAAKVNARAQFDGKPPQALMPITLDINIGKEWATIYGNVARLVEKLRRYHAKYNRAEKTVRIPSSDLAEFYAECETLNVTFNEVSGPTATAPERQEREPESAAPNELGAPASKTDAPSAAAREPSEEPQPDPGALEPISSYEKVEILKFFDLFSWSGRQRSEFLGSHGFETIDSVTRASFPKVVSELVKLLPKKSEIPAAKG